MLQSDSTSYQLVSDREKFWKACLTGRYDDSPLIGGHVWGRGILLIHVASVAHLRDVVTPHQFITLPHTAIYRRLPAAQTHRHEKSVSSRKSGKSESLARFFESNTDQNQDFKDYEVKVLFTMSNHKTHGIIFCLMVPDFGLQTEGRSSRFVPGSVHVLIFSLHIDPNWLVDPLLLGGQGVDFVGWPVVLCARCSHVCLGERGCSSVWRLK